MEWLFVGGSPLVHLRFQTSLNFKKEEVFLWLTDIELYEKTLNNFYIKDMFYQLNST